MNVEAGGGSQTAAGEPLTPGEWLRRERERRGLSLQQAAEDLRLEVRLVEAIETNRFAVLGAPVYAKGHLRKYATLLGLSPDEVIARYQSLSDTPVVPTPIPAALVSPVPPERRSWKIPLWIAGGLIAIVLGWAVFELLGLDLPGSVQRHETPIQAPAPAPAASPRDPQASSEAVAAAPSTEQAAVGVPTTVTQSSAVASQPAGLNATQPQAAVSEVRLRLEFSEPSWTEIYDATGKRLMFDTGMPDRPRTVTGAPPLQVTLGFASGVSATVNNRPVVIPRRAGRDAARFSVQADGSVRAESWTRPAAEVAAE